MNKENTAGRILDAALAEFGSVGYAVASTNRIATAAAVAKGSVFVHFGTKAKLFAAVFTRELDRMLMELDAIDHGGGKPVFERIVDVLAWKAAYAARHPAGTKVMLEGFTAPPPEIAPIVAARASDLGKTSIRRFFGELDMSRFRPEYTAEDVYRILETAANGLQSTYVRAGTDIAYMSSIRDESVAFMKTVIRGMEKHDEERV